MINIKVFIVSFCIGLIYIYFTMPKSKVIIKYPTPDNVNDNIYKDKAGVCYKYMSKNVPCSKDAKELPIQF